MTKKLWIGITTGVLIVGSVTTAIVLSVNKNKNKIVISDSAKKNAYKEFGDDSPFRIVKVVKTDTKTGIKKDIGWKLSLKPGLTLPPSLKAEYTVAHRHKTKTHIAFWDHTYPKPVVATNKDLHVLIVEFSVKPKYQTNYYVETPNHTDLLLFKLWKHVK